MIKLNNKKYDNYKIEVLWDNFEVISNDKKIKGISPFISFNIDNNIIIEIETSISKETLENININEKININQYLTDIIFEEQNVSRSIIDWKYNFEMTKINSNFFKIEFDINNNDEKIKIDCNVELI